MMLYVSSCQGQSAVRCGPPGGTVRGAAPTLAAGRESGNTVLLSISVKMILVLQATSHVWEDSLRITQPLNI